MLQVPVAEQGRWFAWERMAPIAAHCPTLGLSAPLPGLGTRVLAASRGPNRIVEIRLRVTLNREPNFEGMLR
jgi:hypothetical protein